MAGDPFEPELAAAAAATSEAAAMDAVDELLQLDLVRETDVPRRFRFRHPLVRRAVYEATRRRAGGWAPTSGARRRSRPRGSDSGRARPPRRALGARGRRRRRRRPARGRRGGRAAGAGERRALVRGRAPPAPGDRADARSGSTSSLARARALTATGHFADSHGALLERPRDRAGGRGRDARQARPRLRRGGEPPRTARAGRRAARERPRAPARPGLARGGRAHDRARHDPALACALRGDARGCRARGHGGERARRRGP